MFFLAQATVGASVLVLVPNSTLGQQMRVWNVLTYCLIEQGLLQLVTSMACVAMVGRVAEPLWGTAEFAKFLLVVNLCTGIVMWFNAIMLFQGGGNEKHLL